MNRMKRLQEEYEEVPIPPELDEVIRQSIARANRERKRRRLLLFSSSLFVALFLLFVSSLNLSPAFAQSVRALPGMERFVQLVTIQTVSFEAEDYEAHIETAAVTGDASDAARFLNARYVAEGEALYKQFLAQRNEMETNGGGHLSVTSSYETVRDDPLLLTIVRTETRSEGSTSVVRTFDTIDKQLDLVVTLPSLFIDDSYINTLQRIIEEQIAHSEDQTYFNRSITVDPNQSFFINEQNELVIAFDKYEIAAGAYGPVEFVIPTEKIDYLLVSDRYIHN